MVRWERLLVIGLLASLSAAAAEESVPLGLFEGQTDVGNVLHPGAAKYDAATRTYVVSGSGDNMWIAKDDFHFVWKKISVENLTLAADLTILGDGGDGHRKGVLMIRQSLDTDSAYVDVARHGEGLTSLQFRETPGAITREIESNMSGPARLRLEKQGNRFYWWIAGPNEKMQFAGGSAKVELHVPFYVGIGVCAHNKDAVQEVAFSNVELVTESTSARPGYSTIETVLLSGDARTGYTSQGRLSSAGWSTDGHALTFELDGQRREAPFTPLRTAAPVGAALTPLEDKYQYFSAGEEGRMQIWRKLADGSQLEQLTNDEFNNNVLPSLSPDGSNLLFLSYSSELKALPKDGDVELRLLSLATQKVKSLGKFVGGQGSLGTRPWSPDGKRVVFTSFQAAR
jgi:TolB protein